MSAPFPNLYTHRKVAETAARACDICYKPSSSVLITADKKVRRERLIGHQGHRGRADGRRTTPVNHYAQDFFYVCPTHLKDGYFCTPKIDEAAVKAKREKAVAEEMEKVKAEYQDRQRKKEEKDDSKKKDEKSDKDKTKDEDATKDIKTDQKEDGSKLDKPLGGEEVGGSHARVLGSVLGKKFLSI
ncbi:hypothetical protein E4U42_002658 [Claviceps africana]|uniref:DUF1742-domain-containing protein n=1 Tax=Claviceps africana TaxID=83212 RepID=A0A8K0NJL2_9HYPO|nr:hypothetical protein E4U42_002658 [Claviceps africana]